MRVQEHGSARTLLLGATGGQRPNTRSIGNWHLHGRRGVVAVLPRALADDIELYVPCLADARFAQEQRDRLSGKRGCAVNDYAPATLEGLLAIWRNLQAATR